MTQEDKDLLIKDLCARLPYGVKGIEANSICLLNTSDHFRSLIKNIEYKIEEESIFDKSLVNTLPTICKDSGPLNLIIEMAPTPVVVDIATIVSFINYSFFSARPPIDVSLYL